MNGKSRIYIVGIDHLPKIYLAENIKNKGALVGGTYLIHSSLQISGYWLLSSLVDNCNLVCSDDYARPFSSRIYSEKSKNEQEKKINKSISKDKLREIKKIIFDSMTAREWEDSSGFGNLLDNVNTYLYQAIQIINNSKPHILVFLDIPHDPWEIALAEYAKLRNVKIVCSVHTGLKDVYYVSLYPDISQPMFAEMIKRSPYVENKVNEYLRYDNAKVNYSTYNFNLNNKSFVNIVIIIPLILVYKNIRFYFKTNFNNYHGFWRKINSEFRKNQVRPYIIRLIAKICRSILHYCQLTHYQYKGFKNYRKNLSTKKKKIIALLQTRPEATQFPLSPYPDMYLAINSKARRLQTCTGYELYFREHPNMFAPGKWFCSKDISNDEYNNKVFPMGISLTDIFNQGDVCLVNTSTAGIEQSRRGISVVSICSTWWLGLPNTNNIYDFFNKINDKSNRKSFDEVYREKSKSFIHLPWFHVDAKKKNELEAVNNLSNEQLKAIAYYAQLLEYIFDKKSPSH